ncbi:MAG: DMT family transporter [Salinivirgaceae bacterium]|nr:DMT family transporter [Salinivirgaceae bacterium]
MQQQSKAIAYALLAILFWSTVAVPFKIGLQYFHFTHFLFITITIAVVISFISLLWQKKIRQLKNLTKSQILIGVLGGFLNPFLYYLMLFKAYSLLPAQIAQALNYTWPIMLVILSVPFLGQKLNFKGFSTLLIGFVGVYFIASEGNPLALQPSEPFGVILAVSTSIVWACYWLINTKSTTDSSINLFLNFATGFVLTIPIAFIIPFDYLVPIKGWLAVAYSGIFEMGITFIIWLTAMRLTSRTDKISNYVFLAPFLSLLFIYIFLGEQIYYTTLVGLVLIISSIFLNRYLTSSERK